MKPTIEKLKILFKTIKILKNWWLYPIVYLKLTKRPTVIFETKNGFKIMLRTDSTDLMAFTHVWLIEEYSKQGFDIHETDTVIDVGAHIGSFSLYASQSCKKGIVYSFEPMNENYKMLKLNLQLNNLQNVITNNSAISKSSSKIILFQNQDESGHSKFIQTDNPIEVNSKSLNDFFSENNLKSCHLLKLDCEGAEYEIIDSLNKKYFDIIEKMIIEYHLADSNPELLENLKNKLKLNSYEISINPLFKDIGFLYAKKLLKSK